MIQRSGLLPLQKDARDFSLGALYTLPKLSELPEKFEHDVLGIKDQKESDFCTGCATCYISELQERVKLEPSYSFALSKELSGNIEDYGQDLRTAMKTHVNFGAIEEKQSPYSVNNRSPDFLRDIKNWEGDLRIKALAHKKGSYLAVTSPTMDTFDAIRSTIWKFRKEKRGVVSGVQWDWDSEQERIDTFTGKGGGHAIAYVGWDGEYLKLVNSYGRDAGRNGFHWVHRDVVNHYADMFGAFMFIDLSKEEAKFYLDNGTKVKDIDWLWQLLQTMLSVLKLK
jgi:hypothetical protein